MSSFGFVVLKLAGGRSFFFCLQLFLSNLQPRAQPLRKPCEFANLNCPSSWEQGHTGPH